jgi:peptide/nickel transport system substrate-binding protein
MGWAHWYENPASSTAVEPPQYIKQIVDDYKAVVAEPDPAKRIDKMTTIIQALADEFYVLGVSNPPPSYALVSTHIKNFPEGWIMGFPTGKSAITRPEQWYFDS